MKKIITLRIEPDKYEKLKQLALKDDRTVGYLIRKAIDSILKEPG